MASAVNSAATPAASPAINSVNDAVGTPTTERYPGAVNPSQYETGRTSPEPGGPSGPVAGEIGPHPFTERTPASISGGGYQDTGWMSGTDAPIVPWDSNAGPGGYAPSGAVNPDLHADDTGGVFRKEHGIPAAIGKLSRRTSHGQTTVRSSGTLTLRDGQTSPNERSDMDQYQNWNPEGFSPWNIPYAERAILNNVAYQSTAITPESVQYVPSGDLPDNAPLGYSAQAYEAPPSPYVGTAPAAPESDNGIGGGWV